ncbi:MAG: hypothetical protein IPH20_25805 [Bacteroidales bacterium]|nr:hypothetical protein [Bacteroidales bacterium]
MNTNRISLRFAVITAIVASLALSRLLPHPFNFSPIAAMALFGGARYSSRYTAYLLPLAAVWISDLFLNYAFYGRFVPLYDGALFTYAAFAMIVWLGSVALKKFSAKNLLLTGLSASVIFFIVSNFGVWAFSGMYPFSSAGILACYAAAIPFFRNTLAGDLIYTFAVFYAFEYAQNRISLLKVPALKF